MELAYNRKLVFGCNSAPTLWKNRFCPKLFRILPISKLQECFPAQDSNAVLLQHCFFSQAAFDFGGACPGMNMPSGICNSASLPLAGIFDTHQMAQYLRVPSWRGRNYGCLIFTVSKSIALSLASELQINLPGSPTQSDFFSRVWLFVFKHTINLKGGIFYLLFHARAYQSLLTDWIYLQNYQSPT